MFFHKGGVMKARAIVTVPLGFISLGLLIVGGLLFLLVIYLNSEVWNEQMP